MRYVTVLRRCGGKQFRFERKIIGSSLFVSEFICIHSFVRWFDFTTSFSKLGETLEHPFNSWLHI